MFSTYVLAHATRYGYVRQIKVRIAKGHIEGTPKSKGFRYSIDPASRKQAEEEANAYMAELQRAIGQTAV